MLDQPSPIREGEALDQEALQAYLRQHWDGFRKMEGIQQFPGGYSNLTYLLQTNAGQAVLRHHPEGQFSQTVAMGTRTNAASLGIGSRYTGSPSPD